MRRDLEEERKMRLLHVLLQKLPDEWTPRDRKRWLRAFIRSLDLIVEQKEPEA